VTRLGQQEAYPNAPDDPGQRHRLTWLWTGSAAAGLNLALFSLMPGLLHPSPSHSQLETILPRVNVIRVKEPETSPREPPKPPPEPPEPKPRALPKSTSRQPSHTSLTLPFAIHSQLPGGPGALELPPFESSLASALGPTVFAQNDLDAPLTILTRFPPIYPLRAKQRHIEGWVRVSLVVDTSGQVSRVQILDSQPPGVFEQSIEPCVRRWRFRPGTIDGIPVEATAETTIHFELD
jgi:protein TonB